ncbi:TlpA family protein disulfide reductase [Reichenbachiella agarivorans]|uniref:TlpA family protein disulfide reductase n=1 Tax=Reichenbachiella agarivorans TaxID=2979464 RepID=A0ABY6CKZ1_9BACT|nr:TlpA disulfide reductase family protein [Reichenbachiella agarivorans]UXP31186.1 TlpA family protein disulfide reductase [Reichenbachiella agarivorans]
MRSNNFFLLVSLIGLAMVACSPKEPITTAVFSLEVSGLQNKSLLYQVTDPAQNQRVVVDTLVSTNGEPIVKNYDLLPHYYILESGNLQIPILADSSQQIKIKVSGSDYTILGSEDTEKFEAYEAFRQSILEKTVYPVRKTLYALRDQNNPKDAEEIEILGRQQLQAEQAYRDTLVYAVKKMGISIAIYPTTLRWTNDADIPFYDSLVTAFAAKYPKLPITSYLNEKVQKMKQVAVGSSAKDIIASDTTGTDISLYSSMKEYTLIDFWGSWCSPCRTENPVLQKLYQQYKDQGFEIYGVALEHNKKAWIKALDSDKRNWVNVSNIQGYETQSSQDYSVTALPKNFLIDKDGIIIAKDIHGEELVEKINSLFTE